MSVGDSNRPAAIALFAWPCCRPGSGAILRPRQAGSGGPAGHAVRYAACEQASAYRMPHALQRHWLRPLSAETPIGGSACTAPAPACLQGDALLLGERLLLCALRRLVLGLLCLLLRPAVLHAALQATRAVRRRRPGLRNNMYTGSRPSPPSTPASTQLVKSSSRCG